MTTSFVPPYSVRVISFTDEQFGKLDDFYGTVVDLYHALQTPMCIVEVGPWDVNGVPLAVIDIPKSRLIEVEEEKYPWINISWDRLEKLLALRKN